MYLTAPMSLLRFQPPLHSSQVLWLIPPTPTSQVVSAWRRSAPETKSRSSLDSYRILQYPKQYDGPLPKSSSRSSHNAEYQLHWRCHPRYRSRIDLAPKRIINTGQRWPLFPIRSLECYKPSEHCQWASRRDHIRPSQYRVQGYWFGSRNCFSRRLAVHTDISRRHRYCTIVQHRSHQWCKL